MDVLQRLHSKYTVETLLTATLGEMGGGRLMRVACLTEVGVPRTFFTIGLITQ